MIYKIDVEFCDYAGSPIQSTAVFTVSVKKWYGWKKMNSFNSIDEAKKYADELRNKK